MENPLKVIKIIAFALIVGCLFFGAVVTYLVFAGAFGTSKDADFIRIMLIVGNAVAASGIGAGIFLFNKKMAGAEGKTLEDKIALYREAFLIRAATMEGPCFLFLIIYMLTGNTMFLGEAAMLILLMAYFFPTNNRISKEIREEVN